jgi:hypothetical protein
MSEEPKLDLGRSDLSVTALSPRLLSSPLFWMASIAVLLLAGSMLTIGLIAMVVIGDRSDRAKDIQRYHELRAILDEVHAVRNSPSPDFSAVRKRAVAAKDAMVSELKHTASTDAPVKQALLFAARDELPRMMQGDLLTVTPSESNFAANLDSAAQGLGLK